MNLEWEKDHGKRFKKRRELIWVSSDALLDIFKNSPERLWNRLRQLKDVEEKIHLITRSMARQSSQ